MMKTALSATRRAIGISAPSGKVPEVEFALGLERIEQAGFSLHVHSQCGSQDRYLAGTDEERALAFFEFAHDPRFDVLWCARGGYGAARILPLLERLTVERGVPARRKLLLGSSDATVLHEFVRSRWNWHSLHSPMPGIRKFCLVNPLEWQGLVQWIDGEKLKAPPGLWGRRPLKFLSAAPRKAVEGELTGGNLSVLVSLLGTPFAPDFRDRIVFLEDADEAAYRVDRLVQQLLQSGALDQARAVVLGNFLNCNDPVSKTLARIPERRVRGRVLRSPGPDDLVPIRESLDPTRAIQLIFRELAAKLKVPVAWGLPVGHGPGVAPLPLGGRYRLSATGQLKLLKWDWIGK